MGVRVRDGGQADATIPRRCGAVMEGIHGHQAGGLAFLGLETGYSLVLGTKQFRVSFHCGGREEGGRQQGLPRTQPGVCRTGPCVCAVRSIPTEGYARRQDGALV